MDDVISRQAAIDAIGKASDELYENIKKGATFPQRQCFDGMAQAQSILENLPSAKPEIIRCKDCKHHWIHRCMDSMPTEICELGQTFYDANVDFCSLAERRTDEGD
jgi:hypothetical protein